MPTFDTPQPISVTAHMDAGSLHFVAGDRADTVVDVRPRDAKRDLDVKAAEQTEATFSNGTLHVRTPKGNFFGLGRTGTVDVTVELPAGSRLDVTGAWAEVRGAGSFGEVRVKTSAGDVRFDETGPLHLTASHGSIAVDHVEGPAEITTSSGSVRVGAVDGTAVLKNSHGATTVGLVTGDLRVRAANGDITVERAEGSVTATNANGGLRVLEVARGTVQLETSNGSIEVGVRTGTATWLDVQSSNGHVRNSLAESEGPEQTEDTVEVKARTRYGNIEIRRARA
ncbi:DUF4097 family beta strand repeat protein [Streptomyces sp. SID8379]|uniref:DUF4097 family beta strand repeat-containing protein n=1 Tax=unclassified Streptomyces TaxID=2593676 RepID=UPI00037ADF54|nr:MULTISPECIES: DUF4097 family beta strand repeat-containing protein [unclassified Streptomyces]MYW65875.1 DUF4097 family beta strand repeat protein [Streptomyces sp. SID8379]